MTVPLAPEALKPFTEHLEFLGYSIETLNEKTLSVGARHPTRWNFVFRHYSRGLVFTVSFKIKPDTIPTDVLKLANDLNQRFFLCRAVVDKDNDLIVEALFYPTYDKQSFGRFLELLESDVTATLAALQTDVERLLE